MSNTAFIFRFRRSVSMADVEATLNLARIAAASIHGADGVDLDADASVDVTGRTVTVDAGTEVGRTISLVFSGFARREFGNASFITDRAPGLRSLSAGEAVPL